jgi:cellulose biosynthesis protein BcsQ
MSVNRTSPSGRDRIAKNVPIIAFFGTKGGVGKTTLTNKFADLVALAESSPRVLIIDFDVDARGTTILRTRGNLIVTRTIHDYVASRTAEVDDTIDVSKTVEIRSQKRKALATPQVFLIPSATPDAAEKFKTVASIGYPDLLQLLTNVIQSAIEKQKIECVLIDCGPTIDPYTAAAAHIADRAFIIGQNEPISFESLREYRARIKNDYFADFNASKMNIILNKVRALPVSQDYFALIPFTIDVVDLSEGLLDVDSVRLTLLDHYVFDIVKRTLSDAWSHLVPDPKILLGDEWLLLLERTPRLAESPLIKLQRIAGWICKAAAPLFLVSVVIALVKPDSVIFPLSREQQNTTLTVTIGDVSVILVVIVLLTGVFWYSLRDRAVALRGLLRYREEFLFSELRSRKGRRVLEGLRRWAAFGQKPR